MMRDLRIPLGGWNLDRRSIYPDTSVCSHKAAKEAAYLGSTELMHVLIASQGEPVIQYGYIVSILLANLE